MRFQNRNSRAAKLTSNDVKQIRARYAEGETQSSLSRAFQMSLGQIGRIVRGESWQKVSEGMPAALTPEESAQAVLRMLENSTLKPAADVAEEAARAVLEKMEKGEL